MAQNISYLGADYSDVPAVDLPKTGGGLARFVDEEDVVYYHIVTTMPATVEEGHIYLKVVS